MHRDNVTFYTTIAYYTFLLIHLYVSSVSESTCDLWTTTFFPGRSIELKASFYPVCSLSLHLLSFLFFFSSYNIRWYFFPFLFPQFTFEHFCCGCFCRDKRLRWNRRYALVDTYIFKHQGIVDHLTKMGPECLALLPLPLWSSCLRVCLPLRFLDTYNI